MSDYRAAKRDASPAAEIEQRTLKKVMWRLLPLMALAYFVNSLDRSNVSFAALTMNHDIGLTPYVYGWGAGIFYVTYCLFEVPSNAILERVGARLWIARIMITWGLVSGAMALVVGPASFLTVRLLLGAAEAGFIPGMILYITYWFPAVYRGRAVALFLVASPVSSAVASLLSVPILRMDGIAGLTGWQWMFITEAVPALVLGVVVLGYLTDRPRDARWLSDEEREWLERRLQQDTPAGHAGLSTVLHTLRDTRVLMLAAIYLTRTAAMYGVTMFLPQIVKGMGLSNTQVGFVTTVPFALATVGSILWARHSDRHNERRWHTVWTMVAAAAGLAVAGMMGPSIWALAAISVATIGFFAQPACFWPLPPMFLSATAVAGGIAIINAIGNLGGFFGPYIVGLTAQATGNFTAGLYVLAGGAALSALLVLLLGPARQDDAALVEGAAGHAR